MQRKAGGCYAVCTGGTSCNPQTGRCEALPCDGRCSSGEHCESTATQSSCVPGATYDVASKAPGTQKNLPVMPPWVPWSDGPPQIVPAAEQYVRPK